MTIYQHAFREDMPFNEVIGILYRIFEGIVGDLLGHLPDDCHARIIILPTRDNDPNPDALHKPVSTSYQRVRLITPELIMAHIENIAQSKRLFILNRQFKINVIHTLHPAGNGRKNNCVQIMDKRCIFSVCGHKNHCLAESIVYGQELIENGK